MPQLLLNACACRKVLALWKMRHGLSFTRACAETLCSGFARICATVSVLGVCVGLSERGICFKLLCLRSRTGGTWGLGSCSNVAPGLHLRFIRHRVSRNNI